MQQKKPVLFILSFAGFVLLLFLLMQPAEIKYGGDVAFLFPKGIIALKQRNLLLIVQAIMLLVVIPVYILTFVFSWKYRAHNKKAKYEPEMVDNKLAECIWWGIPALIVLAISILTFIKTHELDPYKPIASDKKPLTIQVVALQWKWLFIYPEEKIATVNYLQLPVGTPVHFELTADAPMNSFWIPQLGGQIYAMPKMKTELNLMADQPGDFRGSSANISGEGFSSMHFIAKATSDEEYAVWLEKAKAASASLDFSSYSELAKPSSNTPPTTYQLKDDHLFDQIIMKYMEPSKDK